MAGAPAEREVLHTLCVKGMHRLQGRSAPRVAREVPHTTVCAYARTFVEAQRDPGACVTETAISVLRARASRLQLTRYGVPAVAVRPVANSQARKLGRQAGLSIFPRRLFCRIPLTGHSPLGISFPTLLAFLAAVVREATAPTLTKVMGFGHATALAQDDQGQGGADLGSRRKRNGQ